MDILTPGGNGQTVHISDISKRQLARTVNEQSKHIRQLEFQKKSLCDLLLAIVLEPEAFRYDGPVVTIDRDAVVKVKDNTTLHMRRNGDRIELRVTLPDAQSVLEIPSIIVPPGVN